jgi:O-antigen ligase
LWQSAARAWVSLPYPWLWAAWLGLGALAGLHAPSLSEAAAFYVRIFFGPFLLFVLGVQVARDGERLRLLLHVVTVAGVLVALHSIVITVSGVFLFETPRQYDYLASVGNFQLRGTSIYRAGSFLENPDWNGVFLAMLFFVPVGLALGSATRRVKALCFAEAIITLAGCLCTFSAASFLALGVGFIAFLTLTGRSHVTTQLLRYLAGALFILLMALPSHVFLLVQHGTSAGELSLRLGAWETALRLIASRPFTGIGLGSTSYIVLAEPYRVPAQYSPLSHPHEAYLELAALGGVPLLLAFLALLIALFRRGMRVLRRADPRTRPLLVGVLASLMTMAVNSLAINGWTLAPLAATAWLLFGAATSAALRASFASDGIAVRIPSATREVPYTVAHPAPTEAGLDGAAQGRAP